jgi:RNA polymerase sigma factor (sigma-70 family)
VADDDLSDVTDREQLALWVAGDVRAGNRLTTKYFDQIRGYFVRRVPEEYEELVQRSFLQLARAKVNYRGEASVRVFIYSLARNVLRDYLRTIRRQPAFDPLTTSMREAWGRRPSSVLAEQEHHRILLEALQEIPSADQDLLELYYWRDMTGPELAALFELPEGTVRSQLRAARKRLREKYEEISARGVSDAELGTWMGEVSFRVQH